MMVSDFPLFPTQGSTVAGEVDALYGRLVEGGREVMAPHDAFWNARFAMLVDRFRIDQGQRAGLTIRDLDIDRIDVEYTLAARRTRSSAAEVHDQPTIGCALVL